MSGRDRVAVLWALLDCAGELPFDDDGAADLAYRRIEAALMHELVAHAEAVAQQFGLAA